MLYAYCMPDCLFKEICVLLQNRYNTGSIKYEIRTKVKGHYALHI